MRARVDQGQHEQIVYDFVNEHPVVLNVAIAFFRDDAFADDSTQGKAICARVRALAAVISALDKLIQNPLIFRVYDEDGSPRGVAFNLKASGGTLFGDSEVYRLFRTEDDVALPAGVGNLESFYQQLAASVG